MDKNKIIEDKLTEISLFLQHMASKEKEDTLDSSPLLAELAVNAKEQQKLLEKLVGGAMGQTFVSKNGVWTHGSGTFDIRLEDGKIQIKNPLDENWKDLFALEEIKGEKGDKGDQGDQGERGEQGIPGENGLDGYTPIKGIDYFDGKDAEPMDMNAMCDMVLAKIPKIKDGKPGAPGKDGSPDTAEDIKKKLESLPEGKGLDYEKLSNTPKVEQMVRQAVGQLHGQASKTVSMSELDDVDLSQATQVGGKYVIPPIGAGSGDFTGPASSTTDNIVTFADSTGKFGKDSGKKVTDFVPYIGATTDVNLGSHKLLATAVNFPNAAPGTPTQGDIYYDPAELTVVFVGYDGTVLQIGEEMYVAVVNKTGVQINDGQVVYVSGAQGNRPTGSLAKADALPTAEMIGVATQNIANNGTGKITTYGIVHNFNTSGFTDGDRLWLSATTAGAITNVEPSAPNFGVFVGYALNSTVNGSILVKPERALGLDLLSNSDMIPPSVKAVKTYADSLVAGLLDYRGGYNASVNTWPASGGSGIAGAVLKGDMWVISVAGTLGGSEVQVGDAIVASVDAPGQTAGNWNTLNTNISYVPEDQANKATTMSGNTTSNIIYLTAKAIYDWATGIFAPLISPSFTTPHLGVADATSLTINGTAGAGYIILPAQSSNPASPAAGNVLLHATTVQGFTRVEQDNEAGTNVILGRDLVTIVKNTSGSTINKGSVVYITGSTGNVPNIALAKADSATTLPSIFVVVDNIANNAFGQVMRSGILTNFNTSAFSAGASVWLSPSVAGALTATRPSGANYVQRVGTILVSGVVNGSIDINIAPAVLNMETGTNAATFAANAITCTTITPSGNIVLPEASIQLDPAISADGKWSGITELGTAGAALAFGELCYFNSSSKWVLAKADVIATCGSKLGICVLAASGDTQPTEMLLYGKVNAAAKFPTLTIGGQVYASAATAGLITTTQPSATDNVIRVLGFGNTADELFFNPSSDYITHT